MTTREIIDTPDRWIPGMSTVCRVNALAARYCCLLGETRLDVILISERLHFPKPWSFLSYSVHTQTRKWDLNPECAFQAGLFLNCCHANRRERDRATPIPMSRWNKVCVAKAVPALDILNAVETSIPA